MQAEVSENMDRIFHALTQVNSDDQCNLPIQAQVPGTSVQSQVPYLIAIGMCEYAAVCLEYMISISRWRGSISFMLVFF